MAGFDELQRLLVSFYDERDWRQFQTPKDVAASLAIEAGEVKELFLWLGPSEQQRVLDGRKAELEDELADVVINSLNLAFLAGIDLDAAVRSKLTDLADRHPADEVRGEVIPHV